MVDIEPKDGKITTSTNSLKFSNPITLEHPEYAVSGPQLPPIIVMSDPAGSEPPIGPDEETETIESSTHLNLADLEAQVDVCMITIETSRASEEGNIQKPLIETDSQLSIESNNDIPAAHSTALPEPQVEITSPKPTVFQSLPASSQVPTEDYTIPKIFRFTKANNPYTSPFIGYYLTFLVVCMVIGFCLAGTYYAIVTDNGQLEYSTLAFGLLFGVISGAPSMGG